MIYFQCDYEEGCHPAILKKLQETNWSRQSDTAWIRTVQVQEKR